MSIVDVARAAKVSTATVSRVLNDRPGVRSETATQVQAAVAALNYKPLRGNRRRKRAETDVVFHRSRVGIIAIVAIGHSKAWLQLPILAAVVGGIQRGARQFGFRLILDDLTDPAKLDRLLESQQIDGAVVFISSMLPPSSYEAKLPGIRSKTPIVWVMGMGTLGAPVDRVTPDHSGVGYLAYGYLRSRGCEAMAYLTANPDWLFMRLRGQAFLNSACNDAKDITSYLVGADEMLCHAYGRRVVSAGTLDELVAAFAKANPRPTGLFIANDETTARVYPLLARHNVHIGQDLTIVSCDNEETRLAALYPRPASIDLVPDEIGYRSVVRLVARMQRPAGPPLLIQITPHLGAHPVSANNEGSIQLDQMSPHDETM
jgi:DNA-binding LacI/PurR family transcriptional regulator